MLHTDNAKTQLKGDNDSNYNHLISNRVLKRQRNQSKLIHDSVPDFGHSQKMSDGIRDILPIGDRDSVEVTNVNNFINAKP